MEVVAVKPVLCGMKCILSMVLLNYTSVSSSSTFCCRPFAEFRWCCFRGSNASTIICSVPLISARQKGHPCVHGQFSINFFFSFIEQFFYWTDNKSTNIAIFIDKYAKKKNDLPVLRSRLAKLSNTVCTVNDRTAQFLYLYRFLHIFCITEMCFLKMQWKTKETNLNYTCWVAAS